MNTALNLMPWRARRRQLRWRHSLLALAVSVLVGSLVWWWLDTVADAHLFAQRQRTQALAQQLAEFDLKISAFERHLQHQRAEAIALARLERERLAFLRLLEALARNTPHGVALSEAQQQGDTLTLTARATNSAQIARTVQQWGQMAAGVPVLSAITSSRHDGAGYRFSVSLPWPADAGMPVQLARMEAGP